MTESLTQAEHEAIDITVELVQKFKGIVGPGVSREQDLKEFVFYIHGIQNMILAQAASRDYPERYRLIGEVR